MGLSAALGVILGGIQAWVPDFIGTAETKKTRSRELGLFHSYRVPLRRLNWAVIYLHLLGFPGCPPVRHTRGHTGRFLLATPSLYLPMVKRHQMMVCEL